jgi:hypothetical protein
MTRYLLFSALLVLCACKSEYKGLQASGSSSGCFEKLGGAVGTSWYSATIDVYGRHMSGLLFIKNTGGGNYRTVFTNEAGVSLFDFEFDSTRGFAVKRIINQLDRKPVVNTLREDFSLLLGLPFRGTHLTRLVRDNEVYHAAKQKNHTAYFITDGDCASLRRLELGSARKQKVTISVIGPFTQPDAIEIIHHTFDMVIKLKKIEKH